MKGFLRVCFIACILGQVYTAIAQAPVFYRSPYNTVVCTNDVALFLVNYGPYPGSTLTWQVSTDNGSSWQNVLADPVYVPDGSALEVIHPPVSMTHYQYRAIASNNSGADTSDPGILYVNPTHLDPPVFDHPLTEVCQGTTQLFKVTGSIDDSIVWYVNNRWINSGHPVNDSIVAINFPPNASSAVIEVALSSGCSFKHTSLTVTIDPLQSTPAGIAGGGMSCVTIPTAADVSNIVSNASCSPISAVTSSGASPVTGNIQSCVTVDASVQIYNGIPYVQRHYNIEPSEDPSTSTATLTLYYTQGDFDAYNLARGTNPALPINSADAAGISNLRITQFHGTGTTPGTYTGTTGEINPDDDKIVWNATDNRWEVTFDVTGFSGFFASTGSLIPLPLTLTDFSGQTTTGGNLLKWTTASEQNTAWFEIQRHAPGSAFATIAKIPAAGNSHLPLNYQYTDNDNVTNDTLSYRLRMVDLDGQFTYSKTVILQKVTDDPYTIRLSPNPYHNNGALTITAATTGAAVLAVADISGRQLSQQRVSLSKGNNPIPTADIDRLPAGAYLLSLIVNGQRQTVKLVKY